MKYFNFFIVYILVQSMMFTQTHASNLGGWSLSNPVAQGASVIYQGAKNTLINGKEVIKTGSAKITPTPNQLGKVLARGVAGYALSVAVQEILGAVDFVLDPANNQIKYIDNSIQLPPSHPSVPFIYQDPNYNSKASTPQGVCDAILATFPHWKVQYYTGGSFGYGGCKLTRPDIIYTPISRNVNPAYDPTFEDDRQRTIPLDVVAQRLLDKARTGDNVASPAILAAAADIVSESENDNTKARPIVQQLEQSSVRPTNETSTGSGTQTGTATDPATGEQVEASTPFDFSMQFPVFCGWAPIVCESAQVIVDIPVYWEDTAKPSLVQNWELVKDWATQSEKQDTEIEIPELPQQDIDTGLSFSGQCPIDKTVPVNLGISTINFNFSYEHTCQALNTAKPYLLLVGAFLSALIIGGIKL